MICEALLLSPTLIKKKLGNQYSNYFNKLRNNIDNQENFANQIQLILDNLGFFEKINIDDPEKKSLEKNDESEENKTNDNDSNDKNDKMIKNMILTYYLMKLNLLQLMKKERREMIPMKII